MKNQRIRRVKTEKNEQDFLKCFKQLKDSEPNNEIQKELKKIMIETLNDFKIEELLREKYQNEEKIIKEDITENNNENERDKKIIELPNRDIHDNTILQNNDKIILNKNLRMRNRSRSKKIHKKF